MNNTALSTSFEAMIGEVAKTLPPPISSLSAKEAFLRYIDLHGKIRAREVVIDHADIPISNFTDDYYKLAKCIMRIAFSPEQMETIEWWLYEDVEKIITWPQEGNEWRLDTAEQLWEYLGSTQSGD